MVVYGITGKKEHGKDSFAALVKKYGDEFQILRFADDLKLMASQIFGLPLDLMHSTLGKTFVFPEPIHMDLYITHMCEVTSLDIKPKGIVATTLRKLLQFFGTDYVRSVEDLYWVNRVVNKIGDTPTLIPDTRFPNEEAGIRALNGKIIRINRIDAPESTDTHSSETLMDSIKADVTLGTLTGKYLLQEMAAITLAETVHPHGGAWLDFQNYDFETINKKLGHHNQQIDYFLSRYYE